MSSHEDSRGHAIARLEWLLALDPAQVMATGGSYDGRVFGEWAWDLLGLCQSALDEHRAAAHSFRRAERAGPGGGGVCSAAPARRGACR